MAMKYHKKKPDKAACDPTRHQSMIRSHMYAMTATQPDIAYAIGVLSRYNHVLSIEHKVPLKRVFRYSNGAMDMRLRFGRALRG
jgi:antitoxin component HigA of HigAB toxin-antitoxin module